MRAATRRAVRRRARSGAATGLLAVVVLAAACDSPSAADPDRDGPLRAGPGVEAALESEGRARVVIALRAGALPPETGWAADTDGALPVDGVEGPGAPLTVRERIDVRIGAVTVAVNGLVDRVGADGLHETRRFQAIPALVTTLRDRETLARLAEDAAVRRIDLDVGGTGSLANSVPHINADGRHERGNTGGGTVAAILDTGVDVDHPSLVGRIKSQTCVLGAGQCPDGSASGDDDAGHGTHVAGIVASDGRVGAPGVAPAAEVVAVKVMYNCSFSGCFDSFGDILAGLDYLIANHDQLNTDVVNMSLGTSTLFSGDCDVATAYTVSGAAAIASLRSLGVVATASSGNDSSATQMTAPACLSQVVAVGNTTLSDRLNPESNTSTATDLVAPGTSIRSLAIGGGTTAASGTSMAAPHVAGCAALIRQARPSSTPDDIVTRLLASPVDVAVPGGTLPRLDCSPRAGPPEPPNPEETVTVTRPG